MEGTPEFKYQTCKNWSQDTGKALSHVAQFMGWSVIP